MMNLAEYRRTATRLADFLPWAALVGPGVVLNKDGSFQRMARFRGPDLDSATQGELIATSARLNNALRRMGSGWALFIEAERFENQGGLLRIAKSALMAMHLCQNTACATGNGAGLNELSETGRDNLRETDFCF